MATLPDLNDLLTLPCTECRAACCRYVGIEIDRPATKADHDMVRWYLLHENIHVYIDHDDEWFIEFQAKCAMLQPDFSCAIYDTRPQICREHGWPKGSCEYFEDPHKHLFRSAADYECWLDDRGVDWRWKRRPRVRKLEAES